MPLYEYACPAGHVEEKLEPMSAPETHPCPECGEEAKRKVSQGSFKLEGVWP